MEHQGHIEFAARRAPRAGIGIVLVVAAKKPALALDQSGASRRRLLRQLRESRRAREKLGLVVSSLVSMFLLEKMNDGSDPETLRVLKF